MGCSTLYHLAKFGADAVLLERNQLTRSASFGFRVGAPVALAHADGLEHGSCVEVDIARRRYSATVSTRALFDPAGTRMRTLVHP